MQMQQGISSIAPHKMSQSLGAVLACARFMPQLRNTAPFEQPQQVDQLAQ